MSKQVVLLGETLISLAGPLHRPLDRGVALDMTFAGAEVNVAIGLARLGHAARWVSAVGDDVFGQLVIRGLRGEGVDTSHVRVDPSGPTALMVKNQRPGGEPEVFYYRHGSAMSQCGPESFPDSAWSDAGVLYLTGITPALSESCRRLVLHVVDLARHAAIPIWLDPNHRRKLWSDAAARSFFIDLLPKVDVILAGRSEGEMITGDSEPEAIGRALIQLGATHAVVKDGGEGAWFATEHGSHRESGFHVDQVVDPVGAGDGFAAGVLSARLDGLDWPAALRRGHALGAMVCQTAGDWEGLPNRTQLADFVSLPKGAVR